MTGEGPLWDHRRGKLLWVDIPAGLVHEFDPRTGTDTATSVGQPVGAVGLAADEGLVLALRDGFGVLPAGSDRITALIEVEKQHPASRLNDGRCDSRGRFWAGTATLTHEPGAGALYCLERSARGYTLSVAFRGVTTSNGLDWSLDHRRMYYIDSMTRRIDLFDFDADRGVLSNRRPFVEIPPGDGLPDGMTVDAEGYVWVALIRGGTVRRYSPSGEVDMEISVPVAFVTSCAFGGPRLDELYITTSRHRLTPEQSAAQPAAGGLFVCRPGPAGRPAYLFG